MKGLLCTLLVGLGACATTTHAWSVRAQPNAPREAVLVKLAELGYRARTDGEANALERPAGTVRFGTHEDLMHARATLFEDAQLEIELTFWCRRIDTRAVSAAEVGPGPEWRPCTFVNAAARAQADALLAALATLGNQPDAP